MSLRLPASQAKRITAIRQVAYGVSLVVAPKLLVGHSPLVKSHGQLLPLSFCVPSLSARIVTNTHSVTPTTTPLERCIRQRHWSIEATRHPLSWAASRSLQQTTTTLRRRCP